MRFIPFLFASHLCLSLFSLLYSFHAINHFQKSVYSFLPMLWSFSSSIFLLAVIYSILSHGNDPVSEQFCMSPLLHTLFYSLGLMYCSLRQSSKFSTDFCHTPLEVTSSLINTMFEVFPKMNHLRQNDSACSIILFLSNIHPLYISFPLCLCFCFFVNRLCISFVPQKIPTTCYCHI